MENTVLLCSLQPDLNMLVVLPAYQRRGIGGMLLEDGLAVADKDSLPVCLGATEQAMPLYKRFGFEVTNISEFDMMSYGGNSIEKHISMIRPGKSGGRVT